MELFHELNVEKQNRIIEAALGEFAEYGYNKSSTNRIVKKAGIAKGSLFKYFKTKEELYFYILDYVIKILTKHMTERVGILPEDIFERVIMYCEIEFDFHMENPAEYKLLIKAFKKDGSDIYMKVESKYHGIDEGLYEQLLKEANVEGLKWEKEVVLKMLKWVIKGFNEEFLEEVTIDTNIKELKSLYTNRLRRYLEVLKVGISVAK